MKLTRIFLPISLLFLIVGCKPNSLKAPQPAFLQKGFENRTPTYEEGIAFWKSMDSFYQEVHLFEIGETDAGYPLHVVVVSLDKWNGLADAKHSVKNKLLINNAIHPGEPDGVDASMLLVDQLMSSTEMDDLRSELEKTDIFIIPFYNIGGALNRNSMSRANQNGPEAYGFRGNAQNLDLNRDFVKSDSRNARSFAELIQLIDPDLYIETHVSNGADYQYTMTYLCTQEDKIGGVLGDALRNQVTPYLQSNMTAAGFEMAPYVNVHNAAPDFGYETFYDQPRYSSGYLALHSIPSYITETHMLKPYKERVYATWNFLQNGLKVVSEVPLKSLKTDQRKSIVEQTTFSIDWAVDTSRVDSILFKGYTFGYKPSKISGAPRLFYDRNKPFEKMIPFMCHLISTKSITAPKFYVLQRGFVELQNRLKENGVMMIALKSDTTLFIEAYAIDTFSTFSDSYEKHYAHYGTKVTARKTEITFKKGDWIIPLTDYRKRFLVELLEPESPDSYFNWNYFDAILQQKEWYSAYVFEDEAAEMLQQDSVLLNEFNTKKLDESFANNPRAQLYWLYKKSPRFESAYLRYPVFRGLN